MRQTSKSDSGFTLIEMIVAIVLTGIVAGMVATFMKQPIDAYFDSARRSGLTDLADTATRRMAREVQSALPNSVRVSGSFVEFIPIKDAGRYCSAMGTSSAVAVGCTNPLDIDQSNPSAATDTSFQAYGSGVTIESGDSIVVYNLGIPDSDAYAAPPASSGSTNSSRRLAVTSFGSGLTTINFTLGGKGFQLSSPSSRFQVIGKPVTFECAPNPSNPASGVIRKYWNYPIQSTQPTSAATLVGLGASQADLSGNVSACSFAYGSGGHQDGILVVEFTLNDSDETVSLLHQIPVNNTP